MINITPQIAVLTDVVLDSVVGDETTARSYVPVASPPLSCPAACSLGAASVGSRPRVTALPMPLPSTFRR